MADPEIRDLQIATARAYAIAERLAHELDRTVTDLLEYVGLNNQSQLLWNDKPEELE